MKIEKSDEEAFGKFIITCLTSNGSSFKGYAQKSGNEITLKVGKQYHKTFNVIGEAKTEYLNAIVFTVNDDGSLSFSEWIDGYYNSVTNYMATKSTEQGEGEGEGEGEGDGLDPLVELVCGTYTESFTHPNYWPNPGTLKIVPSDNDSKGNVMLYFCSSSNAVYGTVSPANDPTIVIENQSDPSLGPMGGTLYFVEESSPVMVYGMSFTLGGGVVSYYSANKQ